MNVKAPGYRELFLSRFIHIIYMIPDNLKRKKERTRNEKKNSD